MGPIDGHYDFFLTWEGDRGDRLVNFPRSFACLFVLLASAALSSGTTESFCLIGNHGRYGRAYRCVRKGATFVVEPIPGIMFGGWAEEVYYDTTNETLYVADGSARLFRVDLRAEDLEQVQANEMVFEAWFDACSKAPAWLHLPSGSDTACVLKYDGTNVSKVANADTVLFDHRHVFGIHIDGRKKLDDILAGKHLTSTTNQTHAESRWIIEGRSQNLTTYGMKLVPFLKPGDRIHDSTLMPRGQARMNTTMTNWDYFFMSRPTKPSTQQEF